MLLDPVETVPFTLTDLEDQALAACDDDYLEASVLKSVLVHWHAREITFRELRNGLIKLCGLGLMRTYTKRSGRVTACPFRGNRTSAILVKATTKGRRYLARGKRRYVV